MAKTGEYKHGRTYVTNTEEAKEEEESKYQRRLGELDSLDRWPSAPILGEPAIQHSLLDDEMSNWDSDEVREQGKRNKERSVAFELSLHTFLCPFECLKTSSKVGERQAKLT